VAIAFAALAGAANATTFTFQFDNSGGGPDGTIGTPIVGSGTFTTSAVLTPGLYALQSLPDYSMSYSFVNGDSFSTGDIATPLDGVALDVTSFGSGLRMVWTEVPGSPDADGGPQAGSLDLDNTAALTFEPTYFGGHNLYQIVGVYFGNYLALNGVVPEPATWAMMVLGLGMIGSFARRRRASVAAAT
jgi:hypothetical protein